jgi:glycerophosphoryl diester phosphodiesterase
MDITKAISSKDDNIIKKSNRNRFWVPKGNSVSMLNSDRIPPFNQPWIISHRGYRAKYPENTLAAFRAAITAGACMIELDVALSRDRRLVVIHDATLERTTNGHGLVADFTLAELKHLDAGSWFQAKFADQRLPELSEVLDIAKDRTFVNIEIKSHAYEPHHPPDAIEKQIVALIKQKKVADTVLISSFDCNILKQLSSLPNAPALALISKTPADRHTKEFCTRIKSFSWHPNHKILTRRQVACMQAVGLKVFPYNVDTFENYQMMIDMKVDGVIASDPILTRQWSRIRKAA